MKNILVSERKAIEGSNSAVSAVTVFADRALVTRTMDARLTEGENRISFSSLGRGIIEESIKVQLSSAAAKLAAAELETEALWYYSAAEHAAVWERARETVGKLAEALDHRAVLSMENLILGELRDYLRQTLSSILLEQEVSVPKLREALAFLEGAQTANADKLISGRSEYTALERLLESLKAQLRRIESLDKRERNSIILTIHSPSAQDISIRLSYILPGASWRPVYDSLLDTQAGKVTVRYYGSVSQSTGEAWEGAALSLSTAAVELSPAIPAIHPLSLSAQYQKRDKTVAVAEKEIESLDGLIGGMTTGAEEEEGSGGGKGGGEPEQPVQKNAVSATFTVQGLSTIPSDGLWHRYPVLEKDFPVKPVFECVPELMEFVYVRASFANDSGLPFLAGENHVFRNGSYMGLAPMDYIAASETVNLSFGVDDDLRVRRVLLVREYRPAQGLLGKNAFEMRVKFLLSNFRGRPEKVLVKEAVYLSELKEVEVKILEDSSKGWTRDAEGIVSWEVELEADPAKAAARELHYQVESGKAFDLAAIMG